HFAAPLEPSGALGPSERAPAFGASSFGERARVFSTRALRSRGGAPRFRASLCTASRGTSLFCAARGGVSRRAPRGSLAARRFGAFRGYSFGVGAARGGTERDPSSTSATDASRERPA